MRVTHQLIKNTVIKNIQRNLVQMEKYQNMLSSGKVLQMPSDDPIKVARVMSYNSFLSQNEQYQKNINAAKSWLETVDFALEGITEIINRAREIALTGANGTMSQSARDALAMEVEELKQTLLILGNSSYEGRYIFSGYKTTEVPFIVEGEGNVSYKGDEGSIYWEVSPGVNIKGNITGKDLFYLKDEDDKSIFKILDDLVKSLKNSNIDDINMSISSLSMAIDHVLDKRAGVGALVKGLELTMDKYFSEKINFLSLRSSLEDIDFAETVLNYSILENIYRASISVGARIIQPSLLDFLR